MTTLFWLTMEEPESRDDRGAESQIDEEGRQTYKEEEGRGHRGSNHSPRHTSRYIEPLFSACHQRLHTYTGNRWGAVPHQCKGFHMRIFIINYGYFKSTCFVHGSHCVGVADYVDAAAMVRRLSASKPNGAEGTWGGLAMGNWNQRLAAGGYHTVKEVALADFNAPDNSFWL